MNVVPPGPELAPKRRVLAPPFVQMLSAPHVYAPPPEKPLLHVMLCDELIWKTASFVS